MNTATRLSGFALGLVAVFGGAYGVGQTIDPVVPAVQTRHDVPAGHDDPTPAKDGHPMPSPGSDHD